MTQSRYRRQTAFAPLGEQGQERLQRSRVLIVGCGALGGSVADLLVRAGVGTNGGTISLMDPDMVQEDNLHRQLLFTDRDAQEERYKVEAARDALCAANAGARVEAIQERFDERNCAAVGLFDLVIDATDNFPTRFLLNRAAVKHGIPLVSAGVLGASGQLICVLPYETACLECVFDPSVENPLPENDGILSPTPALFASLQACEAIKILSGNQKAVCDSLLSVDLWNNRFHQIQATRNDQCPVCGEKNLLLPRM